MEADSTDAELPNHSRHAPTAVKIGAVVLSALSFNWLSDIWSPTIPVVMLLALASLGLMTMSDSEGLKNRPGFGWIKSHKRDGLIELCLAAMLLGFIFGCVSLIPLWPTVVFTHNLPIIGLVPDSEFYSYNYEIGVLAAIVLMVTVAGFRAPSFRRQASFLVSAVFGSTFAFTYLRPEENVFFSTFVGSSLVSATAVIVLLGLPRMVQILKTFWAVGSSRAT